MSRLVVHVLVIAGLLIAARLFGNWAAGISDSAAWRVLPWLILVALWFYLIRWIRTQRQRTHEPDND